MESQILTKSFMEVRFPPDFLSHLKVAILIKFKQDLFNSLHARTERLKFKQDLFNSLHVIGIILDNFKRYFKGALTVHPEQLQAALEYRWEGFPLSPDLILYVKPFLKK